MESGGGDGGGSEGGGEEVGGGVGVCGGGLQLRHLGALIWASLKFI